MFKRRLSAIALALWASIPMGVFAHAVDGGEIRWGTAKGSTYWTTERDAAIATWNQLNPIDILPDTASTIEDLSFKDVSISYVEWAGQYSELVGADLIEINNAIINTLPVADRIKHRENVFLHEIGHALGLSHTTILDNVMLKNTTTQTTLGSDDISKYHTLWGY